MALYGMIWIVLVEFLLAMTPWHPQVLLYAHIVLGIFILGLAFYNFSGVRKTRVPGRVKRIAQASYNLSVALVILGILIFFDIGRNFAIPPVNISIYGILLFFHVFISFAIITQAAAIAIAYDMWEDHEFVKETEPGIVPLMEIPKK